MSRKAKRAAQAKKKAPAPAAGPAPSSTAIEAPAVEPIAAGTVEWIWFIGASLVVAGVGLWFQLDVNRVFDVPKAVVLKVGGCGLFVTWLLYALFGPGVRWRSARVFAAPVAAMTVAVIISTLLSVDMATSFNGVYERQFGLQGFLACVGLFFLTATSISGQRGAWVGLGVLAIVGSSIGIYSYFQANGWDPYPFFWNRPHDKVYAFLGNATFAGNALALIMPIITVAASVAAAVTIGSRERRKEAPIYGVLWLAGLIGVLLLQIMPGRVQALEILSLPTVPRMPPPSIASAFKLGLFGGPLLLLGAALLGSWGPDATRLGSRKGQQAADAFGAGALAAMAVGIAMGLVFTRTRGALVGTGVALIAGLVLMPWLAVGTRWAKQVTAACWGTLAVGFIAFAVYVVTPAAVCGPKAKNKCWLYAETFRSIPAAFDPGRKQTGKGQGTRRYLWLESPRVLYNHTATLQRYYDDRVDYAKHVDDAFATRFGVEYRQPYGSSFMSFDRAWRTVGVWFFGIGIETYRYAFMSHKSMRLESLDPMTNHDNPHNNYLYVLASFGLVGLAAYVWLLWSLLSTAFRRFIASERPLLSLDDTPDNGRRTGADLVTEWRFEEADRKPKGKLLLVTKHPDEVRAAIAAEQPVWLVQVQADGLVIRGHDPDTAIERLARVKTSIGGTRADRALAFGIVISFFSYSVYSIAGFDSVACSVFLFFLLGTSAAMFRSNLGETPQNLVTHIRRQWAAFRKLNEADVPKAVPMPLRVGAAVLTVPLLLACVWQATVAYRAERALVGAKVPVKTRLEQFQRKVSNAAAAVRANPYESFYKQSLGNAFGDLSRLYASSARSKKATPEQRRGLAAKAADYAKKAERVLYSALDHAWAPENVYISLFQLYYRRSDFKNAERALERALVHSPHLGAVRANLASLQLDRKAYDEAFANAEWVIKVAPNNGLAWQVRGRVHQLRGNFPAAKRDFEDAKRRSKGRNNALKAFMAELERQMSGAAAPKSP